MPMCFSTLQSSLQKIFIVVISFFAAGLHICDADILLHKRLVLIVYWTRRTEILYSHCFLEPKHSSVNNLGTDLSYFLLMNLSPLFFYLFIIVLSCVLWSFTSVPISVSGVPTPLTRPVLRYESLLPTQDNTIL
jgi:hypothetical protein